MAPTRDSHYAYKFSKLDRFTRAFSLACTGYHGWDPIWEKVEEAGVVART